MPRLIDTHCHLCHGRLSSRLPDLLDRARQAGVVAMVCASANLEESRQSHALAQLHGGIYFTAGVHPHDARNAAAAYLDELAQLAAMDRNLSSRRGTSYSACPTSYPQHVPDHEKNVAIGECGLDYHYDFSPRPIQQRVFAEQADLARRLGKKLVVHTREAFEDTLAILTSSGIDGRAVVFHSFTENRSCLGRALDLGAMISFSGIVTFARSHELRESAKLVPDDRILIETDAPYLSPEPLRKMKNNEPANVLHIAAALANARNVTMDVFAELTSSNAESFFGLPRP
jgi:TatD DNase family protein